MSEDVADHEVLGAPPLMALEEIEGLRRALGTRTVIGQAIGIVMTQKRLTADSGFAYLVKRSSHMNMKLRDVAATIVAEVERDATQPQSEQ